MKRASLNTGKFGKTIQVSLYGKESKEIINLYKHDSRNLNEGSGFHPDEQYFGDRDTMPAKKSYTPKRNEHASSRSSGKRTINNDVDAWLNLGGKAFFVKIEGQSYMTSIDSVQDLIDGKKKGVKLGLIEE